MLGEVTDKHEFVFGDEVVTLEEAIDTWKKPLEKVFPTRSEGRSEHRCYNKTLYKRKYLRMQE